jgi:GTP-binding protein
MIRKATFLVSNTEVSKCPKPERAEIACIGRSNVGKSSLINMLTGVKELAKTSQKPGKTQLINHFMIDERWYLVDLPGYGFAKVSKEKKAKWEKMISNYLTTRKNLCGVFVLVDSRLDPQTIDLEFLYWCGEHEVPFAVIFTKADKQSKSQTDARVKAFLSKLQEIFGDIPDYFVTSAEKGTGKEAVLAYMQELVLEFERDQTN